MVAIPELDGATGPMVFGGRTGAPGTPAPAATAAAPSRRHSTHDMHVLQRARRRAGRPRRRLVALRRAERAQRKVRLVLFNFPPNAGNTGTAAFLSVFESLHNTLRRCSARATRSTCRPRRRTARARHHGNAERFGAIANVHARIPADDHVRRERWLQGDRGAVGPGARPPAERRQLDLRAGRALRQRLRRHPAGLRLRRRPDAPAVRAGFAPTHAFSAFYRWLREDFGADAVLHFGTHGALEFMPGKQAGMSGACWPDRLIGDLPNLYLYASNNPSEGTIAKRRAAATLISYLTPPVPQAGLYRGLLDLKASLERWRGLEPEARRARRTRALIQAQAAELDLRAPPSRPGAATGRPPGRRAVADVLELEYTLIPHGLHVVGKPPSPAQRVDMLLRWPRPRTARGRRPRARAIEALVAARTPRALAIGRIGRGDDDALLAGCAELAATDRCWPKTTRSPASCTRWTAASCARRRAATCCARRRSCRPGATCTASTPSASPAPSPCRTARARPSACSSATRPTATPARVDRLVLWGTDNLKTEGAPLAQALALMGAKPRFDSYGRLAGAELIPLERAGPAAHRRGDHAVGHLPRPAAAADQAAGRGRLPGRQRRRAAEFNFVRKHALAYQAEHGGDLETAALRVFGNADGAYGSNVNHLVDNSRWDDEDELAETYTRRKGFAYGRNGRRCSRPSCCRACWPACSWPTRTSTRWSSA
jgi:magnesium chelatase subunit H